MLLHFALVLHFAAIVITFCVSITFCGDYYILRRNKYTRVDVKHSQHALYNFGHQPRQTIATVMRVAIATNGLRRLLL